MIENNNELLNALDYPMDTLNPPRTAETLGSRALV
jgi:hypothetical protein